jgi:hypothetical protein
LLRSEGISIYTTNGLNLKTFLYDQLFKSERPFIFEGGGRLSSVCTAPAAAPARIFGDGVFLGKSTASAFYDVDETAELNVSIHMKRRAKGAYFLTA